MKAIFKSALVACVALAAVLTSCQKPSNGNDGETKVVSVVIKQKSTTTTRSTLGESVAMGDWTELKTGTLYFFDSNGTKVYEYELSTAEIGVDGGVIIKNVPTESNSVAMIANYPNIASPTNGASAPSFASFTAFKAHTIGIKDQAKMAWETGHVAGNDKAPNSVQGVTLVDLCGSNASTTVANALQVDAGTGYTHSVTINLAPAIARIEIAPEALKVLSGNGTNLQHFQFSGFYVYNYATNYTLGLAQSDMFGGAGSALQTGTNTDWADVYRTSTNPAPEPTLFDEPAPSNGRIVTTSEGTGGCAYHVFPGATMPFIIIKGNDFVYTGSTTAGTRYWRIDEYYESPDGGGTAGAQINEFKNGYVYKINKILVGATQPGEDPHKPGTTVRAEVTVQDWVSKDVYVNPK